MAQPETATIRKDETVFSQPAIDSRINGQRSQIPIENSIRDGIIKVVQPATKLQVYNGNKVEYVWTQDPGTKFAHSESRAYVSGSFKKLNAGEYVNLADADWSKFTIPTNFGYCLFDSYGDDKNDKNLYKIAKNYTEAKTIEAMLQTKERAMRNSCLLKPIGDMFYTTGGKLASGQVPLNLKTDYDAVSMADIAVIREVTNTNNTALNTSFNSLTLGLGLNEEVRRNNFVTGADLSMFLNLNDLSFEMPNFPNNVRKHSIYYNVKDKIEMPKRGVVVDADTVYFVVNKTQLFIKNYVLLPTNSIADATQKLEGYNDNIAYLEYQLTGPVPLSEDINQLKNLRQVQHAGLIQFAHKCESIQGANKYLNYNPGQTYLFNQIINTNEAAGAANIVTRSDIPKLAHVETPTASVQMKIGSYTYPSDIVTIVKGVNLEVSQLYDEYLKVVGDAAALTFEIFKRTFPFVVFSPWSSSGVPTKYDTADVSFSLSGINTGGNTGSCLQCFAFAALAKYYIITPDENCREVILN